MKIIVNPHKCDIVKVPVNEKEINISKCEFEFAEEITQDYVKEAYFTLNGSTYMQIIQDNECDIPYEVLEEQGTLEIGVVAYLIENTRTLAEPKIVKRYNPSPVYINTWQGSLKEEYNNSEPVTATDKEQMEQILQNGINSINEKIEEVDSKLEEVNTAIEETNNLNINVSDKVDGNVTIELTKKDGATKEVIISDGHTPVKGVDYYTEEEVEEIVDEITEKAEKDVIQANLVYNALPKVTGSGEEITLNNTAETPIKLTLKGNTYQASEPTPDNPVEIQVVTGDNTINIVGKNLCSGVKEITNTHIQLYCDLNVQQTITLSVIPDDVTSNSSIFLYLNGTNAGRVGTITGSANTKQVATITFTNEIYAQIQNASSMFFEIYRSGNHFTSASEPQIENNNEATPYTPHQSQEYEINLGTLELCKIGNYQDYIYGSPNNWYKYKAVGKVVLNGNEAWALFETSTNTLRFAVDNLLLNEDRCPTISVNAFLNNNFQKYEGNTGLSNIDSEGIALRNNRVGFGIRILKTRVSDLASFKAWLGNNNTIVYYELAEAKNEQITNAELIEQLNNLYYAYSYQEQTNINQSNSNLASIMEATAVRDLSGEF